MTIELKAYWDEESQRFKEYNDENDLTIHFESAEEKEDFMGKVGKAFRSLEAWDLVKNDLLSYEADCQLSADSQTCMRCTANTFQSVERIIDKHLKETDNG